MKTLILAIISFSLLGCRHESEVMPMEAQANYYPIALGQSRTYLVDEINYLLTGFDTSKYFLREVIFDSISSVDRTTYLFRRDRKGLKEEIWVPDSIWTVAKTKNELIITENNVPFIKMIFPVRNRAEWDGNKYNVRDEVTYYYQATNTAVIDSISPDQHIRVIIEDFERNIVLQDERSELYVQGIGLVAKDYLTLQFETRQDQDNFGEIISGRFLKQRLIAIGNE